jgi:hypothetical protein
MDNVQNSDRYIKSIWKCVTVQVFGKDSNKSKFDSGGNQEEIEFW